MKTILENSGFPLASRWKHCCVDDESSGVTSMARWITSDHQYGVMGLRREFHYGVTTADEGLRQFSPLKLKLPPPPSGRRFQTSQKTVSDCVTPSAEKIHRQ